MCGHLTTVALFPGRINAYRAGRKQRLLRPYKHEVGGSIPSPPIAEWQGVADDARMRRVVGGAAAAVAGPAVALVEAARAAALGEHLVPALDRAALLRSPDGQH